MEWLDRQLKTYIDAKHEGDRLLEQSEIEDAHLKLQEAIETLDRVYRREHDETLQLLQKCWSALVDKNIVMGDQYTAEENYAAARERYQIALELAQTRETKDEIRVKLGQTSPERATTTLAKLYDDVSGSPASPEAIDNFATELALEGYYREAASYFEKLVELTPEDGEAHLKLANALADCDRHDEAEKVYNKAREMGVDEAEIEYRLGDLHNERGDHVATLRHLRRAVARKPDLLEAHRLMADVLSLSGDYDEAVHSFQEVLRIDPEDSEAHFELGNLHEIRGQMELARDSWQRAIHAEPDGDYASFARDKLDETETEDRPV